MREQVSCRETIPVRVEAAAVEAAAVEAAAVEAAAVFDREG